MSGKKHIDIYAGALILTIGAILLAASFFIPKGAAVTIGSDFMPKVTCGLMTVLGLWILKEGIEADKAYAKEAKPEQSESAKSGLSRSLVISVVLLTAYMLLFVRVGFLIMTTAYIGAQATLLAPEGHKEPVKFTIIGFIAAAVIYFIFRNLFSLMLPAGILSFLG